VTYLTTSHANVLGDGESQGLDSRGLRGKLNSPLIESFDGAGADGLTAEKLGEVGKDSCVLLYHCPL
jgi:hypothetical protein